VTGPRPARDPGLQPERTRLAWRRTVLAGTIVALLALRLISQRLSPIAVPAALIIIAGWLVMLVMSWRRISTLAAVAPPPAYRAIPIAALVTTGFAGLGLALVTTP
jgi:hypothetical protein